MLQLVGLGGTVAVLKVVVKGLSVHKTVAIAVFEGNTSGLVVAHGCTSSNKLDF